MDEFVCLTVLGEAGEETTRFRSRLTAFWTVVLREYPDIYEQVYSEAVDFESEKGCVSKQYMMQPAAVEQLSGLLLQRGLKARPVDLDDTYNKAEASSSDWFQINH